MSRSSKPVTKIKAKATYHSDKPCRKCGSTERYRRKNNCAPCNRDGSATWRCSSAPPQPATIDEATYVRAGLRLLGPDALRRAQRVRLKPGDFLERIQQE